MRKNKSLMYLLVVAVVVFIAGCSTSVKRDSLEVEKALIGHWVNTGATLDYYFSDTALIKVEKGGSTTNMTYTIVETNKTENTITIQVNNPASGTGTVLD
ncbi:MAG TPA: hypothetical protein VLR72_06080, partial [Clostridiaceae bacterium]|nr:hypothetical protein [Clostridiaceae bacterium]